MVTVNDSGGAIHQITDWFLLDGMGYVEIRARRHCKSSIPNTGQVYSRTNRDALCSF